MDELRARANNETLAEKRGGAPAYASARKQATHTDPSGVRAWLELAPCVWNCALRTAAAPCPAVRDKLQLVDKLTGDITSCTVKEVVRVSARMYTVAVL
jgi:hypothetical protein